MDAVLLASVLPILPLLFIAMARGLRRREFADFSKPVSVIIPAWNEGMVIERCIRSVLAQRYAPGYDVIAIGGGTDDTAAICKKYARSGKIRFVEERAARGKYRALNDAVKRCRHDIATVIDADCVAPATWLASLTRPLNDKKINVASGRSAPLAYERSFFGAWNAFMLWLVGSIGMGLNALGLGIVSGASMAFRKSFWKTHKFRKRLIEDVQFGIDSEGMFSTFFGRAGVATEVPDSFGNTYRQWGRWCRGVAEIAACNRGLPAAAAVLLSAYVLLAMLPVAGMMLYAIHAEFYKALFIYAAGAATMTTMMCGMRKSAGAAYAAGCVLLWPAFVAVFIAIAAASWLEYMLEGYKEWTRVERASARK